MSDAYQNSIKLMERAASAQGIFASSSNITNYKRIWARDSVICGLAGLISENKLISNSLKISLQLLAQNQGEHGEIPSNVAVNEAGEAQEVSYGTQVGRVDAISWFIIGVCHYSEFQSAQNFYDEMKPHIDKALNLLECWEFNQKGLIYTPQGGNWADDYNIEGYTLYDQVLRLWALRCAGKPTEKILQLIKEKYWLEESNYWQAAFKPSGYDSRFDLFGNALAMLLSIGDSTQKQKLLQYVDQEFKNLIPAFWPVIKENHLQYKELQNMAGPRFKNYPYEYHNGGVWTMLNGWWCLALLKHGDKEKTLRLHKKCAELNSQNDWRFDEYYNYQSLEGKGTPYCTWSAATYVMVEKLLKGAGRGLIC